MNENWQGYLTKNNHGNGDWWPSWVFIIVGEGFCIEKNTCGTIYKFPKHWIFYRQSSAKG